MLSVQEELELSDRVIKAEAENKKLKDQLIHASNAHSLMCDLNKFIKEGVKCNCELKELLKGVRDVPKTNDSNKKTKG